MKMNLKVSANFNLADQVCLLLYELTELVVATRKICKVTCRRISSLLFICAFAAVNCSFPTTIENGNVMRANSNSTAVQITCNEGYRVLGYSTLVCQGNKLRSSSTCEG